MTTDIPGFAEPVADSQACFRSVLDALAHPGQIVQSGTGLHPPAPLAPSTGALLLTLADIDTPLWLGPGLEPALGWIRFHCGAPSEQAAKAVFAVCLELPRLETFNWGSHYEPEVSTTIVLQRPTMEAGPPLCISGPGLKEPRIVRLGLPDGFPALWKANHAAFPRGIDLIVCSGDRIAALPRTLHVETP